MSPVTQHKTYIPHHFVFFWPALPLCGQRRLCFVPKMRAKHRLARPYFQIYDLRETHYADPPQVKFSTFETRLSFYWVL